MDLETRIDRLGGAPVQALVVGREDETDRWLELSDAPAFGIVGETVDLKLILHDDAVPVSRVDVSVNGGQAMSVAVEPGREITIPVQVDRRGRNTVIVETPVRPGELTPVNNTAAASFSGVRDSLRVLLITGEPHRGARAWRDLLKSDPQVDLVHFTILRPPDKTDTTPSEELALIAFPTQELFEEKLSQFDLIVFDRYTRRGVLQLRYLNNMARYVEDGGALLIAAGEPFAGPASLYRTPLAGVLPLAPTGNVITGLFKPTVSELGTRHSVTAPFADRDWGRWQRYIEGRQITGETLMTTPDGAPLLTLDRVGEGRVAELMSDQLWLWARGYDGGGPFSEIVRRLVHWLMKEPELDETRLDLSVSGDEWVASLRALEPPQTVGEIEAPDGTTYPADWQPGDISGIYEARGAAELPGLYQARANGLDAIALRGISDPRETGELTSQTGRVAGYADVSGGSVRRVGSVRDVPDVRAVEGRGRLSGDDWIGLRQRDAYAVRSSQMTPVLPGWAWAFLIGLAALLVWWREGR